MDKIVVAPLSELQEWFRTELRQHVQAPAPAPAPQELPRVIGYKRVKQEFFPDVPESTLRQHITKDGREMGFFKFGKILQCDTVVLLAWLAKQQTRTSDLLADEVDQAFTNRHTTSRKGGRIGQA